MKIGTTTKTALLYFGVFALIVLLGVQCQKEEDKVGVTNVAFAPPPCDSLRNVRYGDTLRVVRGTATSGVFKGKRYWQAMLSSNNLIEPTKFKNNPSTHRIVVADTVEITNSSIFVVARIK